MRGKEIITNFAVSKDGTSLIDKNFSMSDEEFQKEVEDLTAMLGSLRQIKDKGRRRWLKIEIRNQLRILLRD